MLILINLFTHNDAHVYNKVNHITTHHINVWATYNSVYVNVKISFSNMTTYNIIYYDSF